MYIENVLGLSAECSPDHWIKATEGTTQEFFTCTVYYIYLISFTTAYAKNISLCESG